MTHKRTSESAPTTGPHPTAEASHQIAQALQPPPMEPRRPPPQAIERPRVEGQAPVRGLGAPQPLEHSKLVNAANQLLERYKANPADVDPTLVQLVTMQTMARFGSNFQTLDDMARRFEDRLARLERLAEVIAGEDDGTTRAAPGDRASRLKRIRQRRAGANGRSRTRLRGRGSL